MLSAAKSGAADAPGRLLTTVDLVWEEGRREHWIRFGRAAGEVILDRRSRRLTYAPGTVLALVRWASNDIGTKLSRIDILRAVGAGEGFSTIPGVQPGGDSLLRLSGWPKVKAAFDVIDAVEDLGVAPAEAAPDYWRHVHHRLLTGMTPDPYALPRHRAWRLRQDIGA
jgi:hypothetical protein